MRVLVTSLLVLQSATLFAIGKLPPLNVRDISLMLRSGYSAGAVEQELGSRHFAGPLDPTAEKYLLQAGATAALLATLKGGAFNVSPEEMLAAKQELAEQTTRRARQAEEAKQYSTLSQSQLARERATTPATPAPAINIAAALKGDLVTSKNGSLSAFNDQPIESKKLIALYFSARWCPTCRKFTPELVAYYNRVAAAHPEFEIVFLSADRSGAAMEAYMRDTQMPWPAVKFEKVAEKEVLRKYAGAGIPCLVVVDAQGRVLSDSYAGKTYLGPAKVLADLDRIFAGGAAAQVALQH